MSIKGVVIVHAEALPSAPGTTPGTQRVANRPIVCHALDSLAHEGVDALAIVAAPSAMREIRACVDEDFDPSRPVTYLPQGPREDLLGALRAAAPFVDRDAAITHLADGVLGQPLDPPVNLRSTSAPDLLLLLHHGADGHGRLDAATQKLLGLTELNGARTKLAVAGVCVFGPGALVRAAQIADDRDHNHDVHVELIAIAERLAAQERIIEAGLVGTWRRYAGDPVDLLELNRIVLDRQAPEPEPPVGDDSRIEGRVSIHRTAEVHSSTIIGPSIIGARARVSNSYVGPYTSVGAGAEIENAEVAGSILSEGARIRHVSGRIEGSVLGRDANVFGDFRLPRALRLHIGDGSEVALD